MNSREITELWQDLRRFYAEHGGEPNLENYDLHFRQTLAIINNRANRAEREEYGNSSPDETIPGYIAAGGIAESEQAKAERWIRPIHPRRWEIP